MSRGSKFDDSPLYLVHFKLSIPGQPSTRWRGVLYACLGYSDRGKTAIFLPYSLRVVLKQDVDVSNQRVYSSTPGWFLRRHFFRPLTTSAILVPVFPTGWDLARSKKGLRFLASSVPGVNAIR
ncbi:hypothetical protein AVEN_131143-1 [Araneus ventricosus]|uniref:Uncharacterized protein n=1 Tax=Araneus ventricosus TaxID=182803 RepID=A0A4Y2HCF9_ARAVE|nr:hypothetical protein AVEN_131143-1 [Araneus ventricosus]